MAQGGVDLGPGRSQVLRGCPELQNGGLRMEDSPDGRVLDASGSITPCAIIPKDSRPSEGGRVVRLLGQPLGDKMGETKIVQMLPLLRAQ